MISLQTLSKNYNVPIADIRVIKGILLSYGKETGLQEIIILSERSLQRIFNANDFLLLGYLIGSLSAADEADKHLQKLTNVWERQN